MHVIIKKERREPTSPSTHSFSRHILCRCPLTLILSSLIREEIKLQTIHHQDLTVETSHKYCQLNQITPLIRNLPDRPAVDQMLKTFLVFHGANLFIATLKRVSRWTLICHTSPVYEYNSKVYPLSTLIW